MMRPALGYSRLFVGLTLVLLTRVVHAQAPADGAHPPYESKLVELADGLRLQYHDFGGSGLPVIFVQDFHDYFGAALDPDWPPFLARFADDFRVLAPVRRGWGESDDTGYGYDVATQSEDLLGFMDALGIERAVLVGRTPADHDMTWIAEHHPERLAGLIYLHSLHVVADYSNPLIRAFTAAYSGGSCDMRDPVAQVGARTPWRPHFLRDETARIDVPALRFFWPMIDEVSMNLRRLDRVAAIAESPSECASDDANNYFVALASDEAWQAELRHALVETDLSQALDRAMQRAFGDDLLTIRQPERVSWEARLDFYYPHMRSLLEKVERIEGVGELTKLLDGTSGLESDTLALTGVTLIDGTGAPPRPGMTVLIAGDRIDAVFPSGAREVPPAAMVIDLDGHYLIPGIINTHFHLPMFGWARDGAPPALERMLYAGVTTIREMAGDARLSAELVRAALIEDAPFPTIHYAVRMAGPTFYEGGAGARSYIGYEPGTAPWAQAITADTDVTRAVAVAAATGATGIKLYADLDAELVRRIVDEAHRQGLKAWAHGTVFPAGPLELLRAGVDGLSHACFLFWGLQPVVPDRMADRPFEPDRVDLHSAAFKDLLEEMSTRGIIMDATARNASMNPGASAAGCTPDVLNATLLAMHEAGVRLSTGTDYFIADGEPDPTLFSEIEHLIEAGVLSPLEAITAATLNGARAIGIDNSHGSVEPGKVADLVVLSADPTEDISALREIVAVIKHGRLYRRSVYDGGLGTPEGCGGSSHRQSN